MALPSTGSISMSQVNVELGKVATTSSTFNDTDVRALAQRPIDQSTISLDMLYGKSSEVLIPAGGVIFGAGGMAPPAGFNRYAGLTASERYTIRGSASEIGTIQGTTHSIDQNTSSASHTHDFSGSGGPTIAAQQVEWDYAVSGSYFTPSHYHVFDSPNGPQQGNSSHKHRIHGSVTMGDDSADIYREMFVATTPTKIPIGGEVMSGRLTSNPMPSHLTTTDGASISLKYLANGDISPTSRSPTVTHSLTISAGGANNHRHWAIRNNDYGAPASYEVPATQADSHTHSISYVTISGSFPWVQLNMWRATQETNPQYGIIIGYIGGAIPTGWRLFEEAVDRNIAISSRLRSDGSILVSSVNERTVIVSSNSGGAHDHLFSRYAPVPWYKYTASANLARRQGVHSHYSTDLTLTNPDMRHHKMVFIEYIG